MSLPKLFAVVAAVSLVLAVAAWTSAIALFGPEPVLFWHAIRR